MNCQILFRFSSHSFSIGKFLYVCLVWLNVIHVTFAFYAKEIILNDNQIVKKWEVASQYFDSISWYERDSIQHVLDKFLHSYQGEDEIEGNVEGKKDLLPKSNFNFTSVLGNLTSSDQELKRDGNGKTKENNKVGKECLKSIHVIDSALKSRKFWTYQSMYHPFDLHSY